MFICSQSSWLDNIILPQVDSSRASFTGNIIGAASYGMVTVLFYRCMRALLSPANRTKRGIKWGLATHTVATFLSVTIHTAVTLDLQFISLPDPQEFPGDGVSLPKPTEYNLIIHSVIPNVTFQLNHWLAEGLLLYRFHRMYPKDHWVIVSPCLMYLAAVATGITYIFKATQPAAATPQDAASVGISYYFISLLLNGVLAIMTVTRAIDQRREIRDTPRVRGLYEIAWVILTEPCTLYTANFLLFIGTWWTGDNVSHILRPILAETQIVAPFLVVLQEANKGMLTSDNASAGDASPRSQEETTESSATLDDCPKSCMDERGETLCGLLVEIRRMCGAPQISPENPPATCDCFAALDF